MNPDLKLVKAIDAKIARTLKSQRIPAYLGDGNGNVSTGEPGMVYVRVPAFGQVLEIYNQRVPLESDRPVLIGEDDMQPGFPQVLGSQGVFPNQPTADVGPHGSQHTYGGNDVTWVAMDQWLPLLVLPDGNGAFVVTIYGAMLRVNGTRVKVSNQTLNLAAYQPASGALWAMLEISDAAVISVNVSATLAAPGMLTQANLPITTANKVAFCAVKLYDTQTELRRDNAINDFLDLRFDAFTTLGVSSIPATVLDSIFHPFLLMGA